MLFLATAVVIFILPLANAYASPSGVDNSSIAVAALQAKADQAQPRDRCFLYAELVSRLTDLAGWQFNSGDSVQASETLRLVQRTSIRLKDILSEASYEDRPALEAALRQLNQVQEQLMTQFFKK